MVKLFLRAMSITTTKAMRTPFFVVCKCNVFDPEGAWFAAIAKLRGTAPVLVCVCINTLVPVMLDTKRAP